MIFRIAGLRLPVMATSLPPLQFRHIYYQWTPNQNQPIIPIIKALVVIMLRCWTFNRNQDINLPISLAIKPVTGMTSAFNNITKKKIIGEVDTD